MSNLIQYQFNNETPLRIVEQEWFVASDVCKGLEILDSAQAVRQIQKQLNDAGIKDAFSKLTLINTTGGKQNVVCINEAGLNLLIMQSRKKEAIKYKWWIASEVLPSIRKTGSYSLTINTEQKYQIRKAVNERVHRTGEKHQAIYHKFYDYFKINSYEALPASKFYQAIDFLGGINQFEDNYDALARQVGRLEIIYECQQKLHQIYMNKLEDFIEKLSPSTNYNISTLFNKIHVNLGLSLNYATTAHPTRIVTAQKQLTS